jgi:hypothetical protein
MIRYPDALFNLEMAIEIEAKDWLQKALERTEKFVALNQYAEEYIETDGTTKKLAPFWGDVKPVFMVRQSNKCLYCEKKLEGKSPIECDLEHFRPKSNVRAWPPKKSTLSYDFPLGDVPEKGYFLLAYHLHNYGAACKTCNSPYKSDFFPVAAARVSGQRDPAAYLVEEPYLVYPLGQLDEDPEDLIAFDGVRAIPRHNRTVDERKWRRGRVMIDFFGLNRDGLLADRADWLVSAIWSQFLLAETGDLAAIQRLENAKKPSKRFTNCTRCFLNLCATDRAAAEAMIPLLEKIVDTMES